MHDKREGAKNKQILDERKAITPVLQMSPLQMRRSV
jgi:hypothetical protein